LIFPLLLAPAIRLFFILLLLPLSSLPLLLTLTFTLPLAFTFTLPLTLAFTIPVFG
jgi:hypothetical protein